MPHENFWLETAGAYSERAPLRGAARADVCIIGAGFTGLSTALHLKQQEPGLRVVVLEAGTVGSGASSRNAGFCMTLFGLSLDMTSLRFGLGRAREADEYMVRAVALVERLVRDHRIDCDFEPTGLLTVATNPGQYRRLQREMEIARRAGLHETTWLEADQVRARVDSPTYLGARLDPLCALLHPAKLARGLARAAEAAGAVIHDRSPVREVVPGPRPCVRTDGGEVTAAKVVFATNAFSARFPQLRSKQLPVHTYIVLTEPLGPGQLASIGWAGRQGIEDARNFIHYYRLTADNRLLFGGEDAFYYFGNQDDRPRNPEVQARLQAAALRTFPGLQGVRFSHHWGGAISATLDLAPLIGHLGPNILYSVGCMGHGVSLCHLNGATLADLVRERRTELTEAFIVDRRALPVPPEPLRFAVASALRKGLQLQDAWDERRRPEAGWRGAGRFGYQRT